MLVFLSTFFLVFNTSQCHQIEIKIRFQCLCEAILCFQRPRFNLLAIQFHSKHNVFLHDFALQFGLIFATI